MLSVFARHSVWYYVLSWYLEQLAQAEEVKVIESPFMSPVQGPGITGTKKGGQDNTLVHLAL